MSDVLDRFIRYAGYDTQSDPNSLSTPSTDKQLSLLALLRSELSSLGLNAEISEYGVLYADIPATIQGDGMKVGFIAHVDTSPAYSGAGVVPKVIKAYKGGEIQLAEGVMMSDSAFSELGGFIGSDIVVAESDTLLGADDKAGVAEIMAAAKALCDNKDIPHYGVKIAFTCDEEIGRGASNFDIGRFGADYAYTIDGGVLGEYSYENFNAIDISIAIAGLGVHPGTAKGKMRSAIRIANEIFGMLPYGQAAETTEGYDGFVHISNMEADTDKAVMSGIVRDHSEAALNDRVTALKLIEEYMNSKYGPGSVSMDFRRMYSNMKEHILDRFECVENLVLAHEELGIKCTAIPMRGGTDGAALTYKGLPCPNIATGGINAHGRYEAASVSDMETTVNLLVKLVEISARG
ncbi:MAG: peptidase T [Eubacteriaceae bacterium]|nr:peptidase T [Eubacteriaceae bacterium]